MRESFVLYTEYLEHLEILSTEECGILFKAIFAYQSETELPEMSAAVKIAFSFIKKRMDADTEKYEEMCKKRAEAGKLGGRPKANASGEKQMKAKKANGFSEKQMKANESKLKQKNPDNDIELDIDIKTLKEKPSKKKAAASAYADDPALNAAVIDFVEHRKKLRKPMSDKAIALFLAKVKKLADTVPKQIELIDTAIERGWQTVYLPSQPGGNTTRAPTGTRFSNFEQREDDIDSIALAMMKKQMEG